MALALHAPGRPVARRSACRPASPTSPATPASPASPATPATPATPCLRVEDGIRAAYREHGPALFRHAVQSLRDRGLAEEAVQETFVRAWRHADRFDPAVGSLRTWLFAILRNVVIDMARARAIRPSFATEPDRVGRDAVSDDESGGVLDAAVLADALRHLSDEHRRAIVETHLHGRSYTDVAAQLGVPVGTVRSRVFYGLRALRLVLDEAGVTR
jgi:RNA polymerase sigma-70 factor (ECF subfamily)